MWDVILVYISTILDTYVYNVYFKKYNNLMGISLQRLRVSRLRLEGNHCLEGSENNKVKNKKTTGRQERILVEDLEYNSTAVWQRCIGMVQYWEEMPLYSMYKLTHDRHLTFTQVYTWR